MYALTELSKIENKAGNTFLCVLGFCFMLLTYEGLCRQSVSQVSHLLLFCGIPSMLCSILLNFGW